MASSDQTEASVVDHPFVPIPLYDAQGANPLWTDWCSHQVGPEEVCMLLAGQHVQQCCAPDCLRSDMDPRGQIEFATPDAPYREYRRACPTHFDLLAAIGLPVRERRGSEVSPWTR